MAIKINYNGDTNLFLGSALTLPDVKEGIAVDALRVIFQSLFEAGDRLTNKLYSISTGLVYLDDSKSEAHIAYSSIVGDVWAIIDGIRRLELILKHIPHVPEEIRIALSEVFNNIKSVRDSFQHIDERIDLHFNTIGGSVFGEIFWRFRETIDVPEVLHCIISGVSRRARHTEIGTGPELEQFNRSMGVYDLSLIYIKRDGRHVNTHSKVVINIDSAIARVNSLIDHLEKQYSEFYESLDKAEKVKGSGPSIIKLEVTQEAFERTRKSQ